jgi:hypothetical protein
MTTFQIEGNFPVGTSINLEARNANAEEFLVMSTFTEKDIQINLRANAIHRLNITNAPIGLNIKATVSDV